MVEVIEVGHDYRNGQGDSQHTGNGAQASHDLAPHSDRPVTGVKEGRCKSCWRELGAMDEKKVSCNKVIEVLERIRLGDSNTLVFSLQCY